MKHELEPSMPSELNSSKPFVIRGHHLTCFESIQQWCTTINGLLDWNNPFFSPEEFAIGTTSHIKTFQNNGYAQDVLGTTLQSETRFKERMQKNLEIYLSLPDDFPVEIVEGLPDDICKGCAVGEHCRSRKKYSPFGIDTVENDGKCLDAFLKKLNHLALLKPEIIKETAYFSDAEPQTVRIIHTALIIVKTVLAHGLPTKR